MIAFLANAIVNDEQAIKTKTTDDRLGDTTACSDLRDTRLVTQRVNHICSRRSRELISRDDANWRWRIAKQRFTGGDSYDHLSQFGILLFHHKVGRGNRRKIDLSGLRLVAEITHLYGYSACRQ